jgi:hypothetical protein
MTAVDGSEIFDRLVKSCRAKSEETWNHCPVKLLNERAGTSHALEILQGVAGMSRLQISRERGGGGGRASGNNICSYDRERQATTDDIVYNDSQPFISLCFLRTHTERERERERVTSHHFSHPTFCDIMQLENSMANQLKVFSDTERKLEKFDGADIGNRSYL